MNAREQTIEHIERVQFYLSQVISELVLRAGAHDHSKLLPPEFDYIEKTTKKLKDLTYGSEEYKMALKSIKPMLDHHYKSNCHHPEHWENLMSGMSLIDLIEMFADWKAATERHSDGDLGRSIEVNKKRFEIGDQLEQIFKNTKERLDW